MFWHDHFEKPNIVSRTYFGTKTLELDDHQHKTPLPLDGLEAFQHGTTVIDQLPAMFSRYKTIAEHFDIGWIFGPLWYSEKSFVDDQLSLACVAIERLASSFDAFRKKQSNEKSRIEFFSREQTTAVRKALKQELTRIADGLKLTLDQLRVYGNRIDQVGQPPNEDKLLQIFTFLKIPVSELECSTLANRNRCLHGRRTLEPGGSTAEIGEEMLRCDIVRMLVHKGILGLLEYTGPYIDYARRGTGNYPVHIMRDILQSFNMLAQEP